MKLPIELFRETMDYLKHRKVISEFCMKEIIKLFYRGYEEEMESLERTVSKYKSDLHFFESHISDAIDKEIDGTWDGYYGSLSDLDELWRDYSRYKMLKMCHDKISGIDITVPNHPIEIVPHGEIIRKSINLHEGGHDYDGFVEIPGSTEEYMKHAFYERVPARNCAHAGRYYDPTDPKWIIIINIMNNLTGYKGFKHYHFIDF